MGIWAMCIQSIYAVAPPHAARRGESPASSTDHGWGSEEDAGSDHGGHYHDDFHGDWRGAARQDYYLDSSPEPDFEEERRRRPVRF